MSWEKVRRTDSKQLDTPAPGTPLGAPAAPTKPPTTPTKPKTHAKPSDKPSHPYEMNDSEARTYRWRWVEAQTANTATDTEEQWEAAAYIIEVLHDLGVTDVPAYIARVQRMMEQEQAFNRRRLRMAAFTE